MKTIKKIELFSGLLFLAFGIGCLLFPIQYANVFFDVCAALVTISTFVLFTQSVMEKRPIVAIEGMICGVIAVLLWMRREYPTYLIGIVFSLYMFFNGAVMTVQTVLDFRDKVRDDGIEHLILSLIFICLSILSFALISVDIRFIMYAIGGYFIIEALQCLRDWMIAKKPLPSRGYFANHWIALPVYMVSFLPFCYLKYLNRKLAKDPEHWKNYNEVKNDQKVNLRVYIHSGYKGEHLIGHMTISYDGIMYSYGNYDVKAGKFYRSIGPGVLFTVPANLYVNNSCIHEGTIIFEFGLHITQEQEKKLQELLEQTLNNTYRWIPPINQVADGWAHFEEYEHDYSSRLSYRTGAKFRKFKSGPWKTYWVMGDNCSLFAEEVLSKIGICMGHRYGVVSPGEYFQYFQESFANPSSNVVYRSWHDASFPSTLYQPMQPTQIM